LSEQISKPLTTNNIHLSYSLQNYKGRSVGLDEADKALMGTDMTNLEIYLVESQELIKIRGKVK
jgi:hypothetical protein